MSPLDKDDDATTRYPQLNLNTGVSVAAVALLGGMIYWSAGIRGDVSYHEQRIVILESGLRDLKALVDNARYAQAQSETKLEGRLVGIEGLLRDVIARLATAERDRRGDPVRP